jgi:hypothetical protein
MVLPKKPEYEGDYYLSAVESYKVHEEVTQHLTGWKRVKLPLKNRLDLDGYILMRCLTKDGVALAEGMELEATPELPKKRGFVMPEQGRDY